MRLVVGCLVIVAVIAAILLMRLQSEPVSAPWIARQAVERVQALLGPDSEIRIADSTVLWLGGSRFTVALSDIAVDTAIAISGTSKQLDIDVSVNPLAREIVAINEIRIADPDVVIPWPPPLPTPRSPWPAPVGPLDGANRILDNLVADHGALLIANLSVSNGRVRRFSATDDAPRPWLNDVAGLASVSDSGNLLSVVLTGRSARDHTFDAAFERAPSTSEEGGHTVSLSVRGFDFPFSIEAAADPLGRFGWVPVDLSAYGDFTADYDLRDVRFMAEMGPGTIPLGTQHSAFLKTGQVELSWQPVERRFRLSKAHFEIGDSVADLTGTLWPEGMDPLNPWQFDLATQDASIDPADVPGPPIVLERVIASGTIRPRDRVVQLDRFSVLSPQAPVEGVATFTFLEDGLAISGATNIGRVHSEVLKRIWPSFIADDVRRWVLQNVIDGVMDWGRIDMALGPEMTDGKPETSDGADDAVDLQVHFSGVTMKSLGSMSNVHNGKGVARLKGRRFEAEMESAAFYTPDGEKASASNGRFAIADVFSRPRKAELSFTIEGKNEIIAAIADQSPIHALNRLGVAPNDLSGHVSARVDVVFPLMKQIDVADVEWVVDADFDDLSSAAPIDGRSIKDADVNIVIDPQTLTMSGIATLDGVRANIQVTEPFGDPTISMSGDLTLVLSEKERSARGLDLGDVLKGPVAVGIGVLSNGDKQVAVDLTKAVVNIPVFGWTKARGIAGKATFLLKEEGKRLILEDFKMVAGDAVIEGKLVINGDGRIETAAISRFTVRKGDVATVTVKLIGKQRYQVDFIADNFDGRGLIKTIKSQQASDEEGEFGRDDFVVSIKAHTLIGFHGETLRDVDGALTLARNEIQSFKTKAKVGGKGLMQASVETQDGASKLLVTTSDSGSLLRFLNIYEGVENGKGFLQSDTDAAGRTSGHVTITDLTVKTSQEFSKSLEETTKSLNVRDVNGTAPNRSDSRTSFEKFRAGFDKTGGLITVTEAFVRSPLVGGSFSGDIDLTRQSMALTGTMIPAYGLNNLFGQIPILGTLMGAGRHGGLVGVTFRVNGSIDDPKLQINPVSALAPGIFRKIFEFK